MSLEEALAERTLWNNINTETQTSNGDLTLLLTDCPAALPEEEAAAVLSPTRRSYPTARLLFRRRMLRGGMPCASIQTGAFHLLG